MGTTSKVLEEAGLGHLIALIKGADESLRSELKREIDEAVAGAGPGVRADGVTIADTDGVLSVRDGGIGTAQLADASVTRDKLSFDPTDGITADAVGAAPAKHVHDAADVTTGVLSVERGGTGVTTDDAAYQKYVTSHYLSNDELLAYLGLG